MKKLVCFTISIILLLSTTFVLAEETPETPPPPPGVSTSENLYDDCANFEKTTNHSNGIYTDIIAEENQYAFPEGDFTMFMRREATAEWLEYPIPSGGYFVFKTFFRQNEEISHFKFEYSEDGETWERAFPKIETKTVEDYHWIPVLYTCDNLPKTAKFIRIIFQNLAGTEWSPAIASVDSIYLTPQDGGFSDCIGTAYYNPTAILKNLGLINGYSENEFNPNGSITRAEFCKMTASMLNLNVPYSAGQAKIFHDIESDYWAAGAIYALYGLGIIVGDEHRNFNPESNITFSEAEKIIVSMLGYSIIAEENGGYPDGYSRQVGRLGILDGLSDTTGTKNLNRGMAATMLYNSLDVELIYQTQFGDNNIYNYDGNTILNKFHGIYKCDGIVTDVGSSSIISDSSVPNGMVVMGDITYNYTDFDMQPFLGRNTHAYAQKVSKHSEDMKILYAYTKTPEINVSYNDYINFHDDYIYYFDENKNTLKSKITANTRVIYNNRYATRIGVIDKLDFKCGDLKLINNNKDSDIDVILIDDYDTYYLKASSKISKPLTDKYLGAVDLNLDTVDTINLYEFGKKIPYDPEYLLNKGNVVHFGKSLDGKVVNIFILGDYMVGAISYANTDLNEYEILNKKYKLSEYFIKTGQKAKVSENEVTIFLDKNKNIVTIEDDNASENYGYLQSVSAINKFDNSLDIRVVTKTGTAEVLSISNSTKLNNNKNSIDKISKLSPQLIKFKLRKNGEVSEIVTAVESLGLINEEKFTHNFMAGSTKYMGENTKVFGSIYQLTATTQVFIIPADMASIKDYKVTNFDELYTDYNYAVDLYDVTKDYKTGAVVIRQQDSDLRKVSSYDAVAVVKDSALYLDEDGNNCLKVYAYANGENAEILFGSDGAIDMTGNWLENYVIRKTNDGENSFKTGEIFQYYVDGTGKCHSFRMLKTEDTMYYEKNLGDYGSLNENSYYSELYSVFGKVTEKFSEKMFVSNMDAKNWKRTVAFNGSNVYVFNQKSGDVRLGSPADISVGDEIFVRMYYTDTKEILIIE
ncbi:MAG: S-layer homology domain-containing protein [Oscillospiraceae bacterium]